MTANRQGLCNWLTRPPRAWFWACLVGLAFGNLCGQGHCQQPQWKTGAALRKELERPLSITWGDRELREAVASLVKNTGVAILLDRRLDPARKLELIARDESLQTLLTRVAEQMDCGVSQVGSVVYLGPRPTANKLTTLASVKRQQALQLPPEAKSKLAKSEAWHWDEAAQPGELLAALAQQGGVTIENADLLPLDVWPAANLPAMPWTDRMTLLLAGFELTFELVEQGAAIRLVPLPDELVVEKTYAPRGNAEQAAADLRRIVPRAKITLAGQRLKIAASTEDHEKIDKLLRGESVKTTQVTPGEKHYTLTVENQPAGAILNTLAKQLGKELKFERALVEKLQTKLTFRVKEASLAELLDKTLTPLGLSHRLDEKMLEIVPKE